MNAAPELLEAAAQGDEQACEQMLRENSGLIWSIVRRYYGRGVEPDDLYQLGCLGFIKAIKGFDFAFGTQFSCTDFFFTGSFHDLFPYGTVPYQQVEPLRAGKELVRFPRS